MSATAPCVPCCGTTALNTQIPGVEGDDGQDGSNGQNAYTLTTADFIIPAINNNVTISVENSDWMAIGQTIVTDGPATFQVVSKGSSTSATLKFLGYTGDLAAGVTVSSGATVSPAGVQFTPTQPAFAANMNGVDQVAIADGAATLLQFSNEVFDNNADFDVTTYTFTPTVAGLYLFTVTAEVKAMADQKVVTVYLYKNGVAIANEKAVGSGAGSVQASVNFRSEANGTTDAFTAYVKQDSGGAATKDVDGANTKTYFQGNFIGTV